MSTDPREIPEALRDLLGIDVDGLPKNTPTVVSPDVEERITQLAEKAKRRESASDLSETLAAMRENLTLLPNPRKTGLALLSAVENVLALHEKRALPWHDPRCLHCDTEWPCPTVKALTDALGGA